MQRSRRRQKRAERQKPAVEFRVNEFISSPTIFLIDEEGTKLGAMDTKKALALARERGYDLIEVGPKAQPPVAKFEDFGRLQYEAKKKLQKQRAHQKRVDVKGVRISVRISDHDRMLRMRQARGFLAQGHKVKVELILRGREHIHKDLAFESVKKFVHDLMAFIAVPSEESKDRDGGGGGVEVEQNVTRQGSKLFAILKPASGSSTESSE